MHIIVVPGTDRYSFNIRQCFTPCKTSINHQHHRPLTHRMNTRHSTLSAHPSSDQRARSGSHGHYRMHSNSSTEFKPGSAPTGGFGGYHQHLSGASSDPPLRRHAPHGSFDSEPDIHTYDRRRLSEPMYVLSGRSGCL